MSNEHVDPNGADMAAEYLDLDVFKPKPYKHVTIEGVKYGVMHPSDLSFDQWIEVLETDKVLVQIAENPREATDAGKKKIAMLIPDLPAEVLNAMVYCEACSAERGLSPSPTKKPDVECQFCGTVTTCHMTTGLNPKRVLMLINFVTTEVRKAAAEQQENLEAERSGNVPAEAEAGTSEPAEQNSTSAS